MRGTLILLAVLALLGGGGEAAALEKCKATIKGKDGTIEVKANAVAGALQWGYAAGQATNDFADPACVEGGKAKKCVLGAEGTLLRITPPPGCTLYLADAAETCTAFLKKCTPGTRPLIELPSRYVDLGYAVLDTRTGLEWQKQTDDGTFLDKDKTWTWCADVAPQDFVCDDPANPADGTAFTEFLPQVNGTLCSSGACTGVGGHSDWEMPTIAQLQTILLSPFPCLPNPCIDPIFGPTASSLYWSATSLANNPINAWYVFFGLGDVSLIFKFNDVHVRAVRGGS